MVLYFTATGNSLYVAKQFSDAPVSIPQIMRGKQRRFSDDTIGIVCPIFAGQPPKMVVKFLEESEFEAEYLYIILTYGHDESDSPEFTARLAEKYGVFVDYIAAIKMVDNYLPVFDMEEETALEKHVEEQIETAVRAVSDRKHGVPEATKEQRKLHARVARMNRLTPAFNNGSQIKVNEGCIGCGICVKVCPVNNFYVENGQAKRKQNLKKAKWQSFAGWTPVKEIMTRRLRALVRCCLPIIRFTIDGKSLLSQIVLQQTFLFVYAFGKYALLDF